MSLNADNYEKSPHSTDTVLFPDDALFVIDRGEKRAVWSDEEECDREISLGDRNITKKLRTGDGDTMSGRQLEVKLRSQVSGNLLIFRGKLLFLLTTIFSRTQS